MAKCKCSNRPRIVSNAVQSIKCANNCGCCMDVCANPIVADPSLLGIMAPLVYDEIGINLCTTFGLGVDVSTAYPTATSVGIQLINATFDTGTGTQIEAIAGRPNCYLVTLSNITVQFAVNLYDSACRTLGSVFPTAVYLPRDTTAVTYDEDTNPTSVELELFAPYGLTYNTTGAGTAPVINFVGFNTANNMVRQGINLFGHAKLLDFDADDSTVTVGLTLILQSLYFAGYKVKSAGKIDVPKGSIVTPDNSDCLRFVAGELLNLAIKPLDLGWPEKEERLKHDCDNDSCATNGAQDDTTVIS